MKTKDDEERRLKFKSKLARLALERNYLKGKTLALFEFVYNIMRLSKPKEEEFEQGMLDFFNVKTNDMKSGIVPVSKRTLDLFDEVAQRLVGEKMTELKQKYLMVKAEVARQKEEVARQKEKTARQKAETAQQFEIIRLHSKSKFSPEKIAELLKIELSLVKVTIEEFFN